MRLRLLVSAGILLMALSPSPPCGAQLSRGPVPGAPRSPQPLNFLQPEEPQQPQPVLIRMGEEYFLRLGNLNRGPTARLSPDSSPLSAGRDSRPSQDQAAANFFRVLLQQQQQQQQQQMPQFSLDSRAGPAERGAEDTLGDHQGARERVKRAEPAISLDLTFHLLREVLEIVKADQLVKQAHKNRKLLEMAGK
ncbi:corticoliberin [Peromyscus californicus insignis]|uniref:corticoliberin n=1 Tax=Peromyscus californicus insignis TaxID=564181 RepID=UPI0022A74FCB|nr:corticoliberin [Peromyscus californicus insignis]